MFSLSRFLKKQFKRCYWGSSKVYNNKKFNAWRALILRILIQNEPEILIFFNDSRINAALHQHWVDKPMRGEYHVLVHFYRLAVTALICKQFIQPSTSILDVGCASGTFLKFWPKNQVRGFEQLDNCQEIGKKLGVKIDVGNAENLPYDSNCFDNIFLLEVIEHVENPYRVIEECIRVGKSRIVVSLPVFETTKLLPYKNDQPFIRDSHYLELNYQDFINLISHFNIQLIKYELLDLKTKLGFRNKIVTYLTKFKWPCWHIFILKIEN